MTRPPAAPRSGLRDAFVTALPSPLRFLVGRVLAEAEKREAAVHAVGGPVRDLLLGRELRDVDLLVEPRPGADAEALARASVPTGGRVVVHERFGTVRLETKEAVLDFANTRRERYPSPGALPEVEPGTLEEDLLRRDFSVNALAVPLTRRAAEGRPALLDLGGAQADLEARVLRVFHPRSFHDDPTRALRAARLAARLGFRLDRGSRTALRDALRDGAFAPVSGDRLRRELEKLFEDAVLGQEPQRALRLLAQWHVLGVLEPGLDFPRKAVTPVRLLGRAVADPPWPRGSFRAWVAGFAVWLAVFDATLRRRSLRRLDVRGELSDRIAGFARQRQLWQRALASARGRSGVDAVLQPLGEEQLHALYAWAPPALRRRIVRWAGEDRGRRAPVDGSDLVAIGLEGPAVGRALARIRAATLDGLVRTREEALALAHEIARRSGRGRPGRRRGAGSGLPRT